MVYVGRIAPNKGLADFIRAADVVRRSRPRVRALVCGWAPSEHFLARILSLVKRLALDDIVEVRGYVPPDEKSRLLSRAKLFVSPSYEEGWSLSVMEAILMGAMPVVYDLPAYDYLGPHVIKVPAGDIIGLATSILSALGNLTQLQDRVDQLGEIVAGYTPRGVASDQLSKFTTLCGLQSPFHQPPR
jgi:glycosyltransferase involved in cell wall biosynthesis